MKTRKTQGVNKKKAGKEMKPERAADRLNFQAGLKLLSPIYLWKIRQKITFSTFKTSFIYPARVYEFPLYMTSKKQFSVYWFFTSDNLDCPGENLIVFMQLMKAKAVFD